MPITEQICSASLMKASQALFQQVEIENPSVAEVIQLISHQPEEPRTLLLCALFVERLVEHEREKQPHSSASLMPKVFRDTVYDIGMEFEYDRRACRERYLDNRMQRFKAKNPAAALHIGQMLSVVPPCKAGIVLCGCNTYLYLQNQLIAKKPTHS